MMKNRFIHHAGVIPLPIHSSRGRLASNRLYDEVTAYCENHFDLAGQYNQTAARLAMMVLQRRLASSTFALWRSLIRREEKLQTTLRELREGRLSLEGIRKQHKRNLQASTSGIQKRVMRKRLLMVRRRQKQADESLAQATTGRSITDLEAEIHHVQRLTELARAVYDLRS